MNIDEAQAKLDAVVEEIHAAGFEVYGYEGEGSGIVIRTITDNLMDRDTRWVDNRWAK